MTILSADFTEKKAHEDGELGAADKVEAAVRAGLGNPFTTRDASSEVCWGRAFAAGRHERDTDAPAPRFRTEALARAYIAGRFGLAFLGDTAVAANTMTQRGGDGSGADHQNGGNDHA
jgi:hypothetical protein